MMLGRCRWPCCSIEGSCCGCCRMAKAKFCGICRGGPFDGKMLEHDRDIYRAAKLPPISFRRSDEPPSVTAPRWGSYRLVLGQWIWRADADHQNVRMP